MCPGGEGVREKNAQQNADDASGQTEGGRFHQELHQNVAAFGADGLANTNFACPLGDRNQHDVHNADPANDKGHTGNGGQEESEGLVGLLKCRDHVRLVADGKIIVLVPAQAVLPTQYLFHFQECLINHLVIDHLDRYPSQIVLAEHAFLRRSEWD